MSSGGCDPPRPPPPSGNKGKGTVKGRKRYEIKVLSQGGRQPSPAPAPTTVSTPSSTATASTPSPTGVAATPSPATVAATPSPTAVAATPSPTAVASTPSPTAIASISSSAADAATPSPAVAAATPSPAAAAATPSPAAAAATPSPTIRVNDTSFQQQVEHMPELDEEDRPLGDRDMIRPTSSGFVPSKTASKAITWTIKQQFQEPWPTWGAIPKRERDIFFQRFKRKVTWRPEHENQIKKNFHSKASHRLSEMFREARRDSKKPKWIGDGVWNSLLAHWNTSNFRSKCTQAQVNRASDKGGTLHTGGSISVHDHAIRMSEEYGRPVHIDEVFQQTHIRKDTGQFVDDRSRQTHEDFETRLSQARSESASCAGNSECTPLDPAEEERLRNRCWFASAGGLYKGRVYGTGGLTNGIVNGNNFMEASSSRSHDSEEINHLRQEICRMSNQFQSFVSTVLPFLPPPAAAAAQTIFQQQQNGDQQQGNDNQQQDNGDQQQENGNQQQQQDGNQQQQQQDGEQQHDSTGYSDY